MIRLLAADDHPLMLSTVRDLLEADGDFEIVGEALRGDHVLELVAQHNPDVVLLELRLPGLDGLVCLEQISERFPDVKVLVLSADDDAAMISNVLERGAAGYVVKSVNPHDLGAAIRQVVEGTVFQRVARSDADVQNELGLTQREPAVLEELSRGLANGPIARELWVSEQTVKFHLTSIYRKLGVTSRTQAARYALERGIGRRRVAPDRREGESSDA